jgi:16S rRNA (cytosine967-C5)-methyltransferase
LVDEGVRAEALELLPAALVIRDSGNRVFETRAMKSGRLHVQDLGSQLIAELCRPVSGFEGTRVADICAGAGGKTITLADRVGPKGRVLASDLSRRRLEDARERTREFGLRNVSFPVPVPIGELDAVLIDAPCSGVGSLAREPDQKWKLSAKSVSEFASKQRQILSEAAGSIRPGAVLVYATCSLLREEDEGVVEGFLKDHPEFELQSASEVLPESARIACEGPYLRAWPDRVPGGGFFAARLVRRRAEKSVEREVGREIGC